MSKPSLKVGDKGNDVIYCQNRLNAHGHGVSVDGIFGKNTSEHVMSFQKEEGLQADGIVGPNTWTALERPVKGWKKGEMIDWWQVAELLSNFKTQKYRLSKAECPSNPPGVSLKRIGTEWTNCVLFTSWILSMAFDGVKFDSRQWKLWMVSGDFVGNPPVVPNWGPRVAIEWGVGTQSPGRGAYLVQYFTETGGHSLIVVDHCSDSDKILTLEAVGKHDGVCWYQIGHVRDCPNPGLDWKSKVTQTWESRLGTKQAVHVCRLMIDPDSIIKWLSEK